MSESGYYPLGAEHDPRAPYNEVEQKDKEVEVEITLTLTKKTKILVDDYEIIGIDKDEEYNSSLIVDYSDCDLVKSVKEQLILPNEAHEYVQSNTNIGRSAIKDLKGWNIDDIDVNII